MQHVLKQYSYNLKNHLLPPIAKKFVNPQWGLITCDFQELRLSVTQGCFSFV